MPEGIEAKPSLSECIQRWKGMKKKGTEVGVVATLGKTKVSNAYFHFGLASVLTWIRILVEVCKMITDLGGYRWDVPAGATGNLIRDLLLRNARSRASVRDMRRSTLPKRHVNPICAAIYFTLSAIGLTTTCYMIRSLYAQHL